MKQAISLALSLVFAGVSALAALAVGTGYEDVPAAAWYAGAVRYVSEKGLMSGTGNGKFSPDATMTRAMLASVLYRNEGQPLVVDIGAFSDVHGNWYASAANWAAANGIVSGYGDGRFGGDDSVTRQDMAAILWRYAGSPAAANSRDFADEASIASYAAKAVDWARANGIISGKPGNRFDPRGLATGYDGSKPYALFVTLPGYEGLYFQGVGVNIRSEDFGTEAQKYNEEMIIIAPQLNDWGNTSARQAVALTRYILAHYNIDPSKVYLEGYSGGGETGSLVMELAPELYTAYLLVSSQWDGDLAPVVESRTPVYLATGENDSYYGSDDLRETYAKLREMYKAQGLSEVEVNELAVMDLKPQSYFDERGVHDQHAGGGLFAHDEKIMGWLFREHPAPGGAVRAEKRSGLRGRGNQRAGGPPPRLRLPGGLDTRLCRLAEGCY